MPGRGLVRLRQGRGKLLGKLRFRLQGQFQEELHRELRQERQIASGSIEEELARLCTCAADGIMKNATVAELQDADKIRRKSGPVIDRCVKEARAS